MDIFIIVALSILLLMGTFLCFSALYIIRGINGILTIRNGISDMASFASILIKKATRFFENIDHTDELV